MDTDDLFLAVAKNIGDSLIFIAGGISWLGTKIKQRRINEQILLEDAYPALKRVDELPLNISEIKADPESERDREIMTFLEKLENGQIEIQ